MPDYSHKKTAEYLDVIQQTPGDLEALLKRLPEQALNLSNPEGDWRPLDILIHLNACQKIWGFTIFAILAAEKPALPAIHPSRFAKISYRTQVEFSQLLSSYTSERSQIYSLLKVLTPDDWNAAGLISNREHSVFSQVRRLALHEKKHWSQITSFLP